MAIGLNLVRQTVRLLKLFNIMFLIIALVFKLKRHRGLVFINGGELVPFRTLAPQILQPMVVPDLFHQARQG